MPNKDKNQEVAQELKDEFKKGNFKPSQLKRSKSLSDISQSPKLPTQELITLRAENKDLRIQLSELTKHCDQQVNDYQQQIEQLKQGNNQLTDHNNELRLQALKNDDKIKEHNQEMNQAAEQFNQLEDQKNSYQVQNNILLREKKDLAQQLKSAQDRIEKLYQLKGLPTANENPAINWNNLLVNSLLVAGVIYLLWPVNKYEQ